jgi:uncharacterized protein YbaA (DUF1428 family)
VLFPWIVHRSRAHRDQVNKQVMKDARVRNMMTQEMAFDMKRMSYRGFKALVDI